MDDKSTVLITTKQVGCFCVSKTISQVFADVVLNYPQHIALHYYQTKMTYQQLDEKVAIYTSYLQQYQAINKAPIAICLPTMNETILALLAVLRSGNAFLPIDLNLPRSLQQHMLRDSGAQIVITSHSVEKDFTTDETQVVLFVEEMQSVQNEHIAVEQASTESESAYVIYTSGTTSKPKGVQINNDGLMNTILAQIEKFSITTQDNILAFANVSFDASIAEIFTALLSGAKLTLLDRKDLAVGENLAKILYDRQISLVTLPPSVLATLPTKKFPQLRAIVCAGEKCPLALAESWASKVDFYNAYGPTEASICVTIEKFCENSADKLSIGSPIANTHIYILDKNRQVVPLGCVGEICISGIGVAKGYLNLAEISKEKFINNPFDDQFEVLYKTGDLGRWLPSGKIEFLGRMDRQIKLRGFRVELDAIEDALQSLDCIEQAVVDVSIDSAGKKRLTAFFVAKPKSSSKDFNQAIPDPLSTILPSYMLPNKFINLPSMPLNKNGKVDVTKLKQFAAEEESNRTVVVPKTKQEKLIAKIWQKYLARRVSSITDNFFELGGDSITATQIVNELNAENFFCVLDDVFKNKTIDEMIKNQQKQPSPTKIQLRKKAENNLDECVISSFRYVKLTETELNYLIGNKDEVDNIYPLTPTQHGLLFHCLLVPNSNAYIIQDYWKFSFDLDVEMFKTSWQMLIERHDILRTRFVWERLDIPLQVVQSNAEINWQYHDWRYLTKGQQENELNNFLEADKKVGFNLKRAPNFRVVLIQVSDKDFLVILTLHHIILDGLSVPILLNNFQHLYKRLMQAKKPINMKDEMAKQGRFCDYVHWQRNQDLLPAKLFWKKYLADSELPQKIPFQMKKTADLYQSKESDFCSQHSYLSSQQTKLCVEYAKSNSITLNSLFSAIWSYMLSYYCQTDDVLFGIALSGRNAAVSGIDNIVGLLINTVPLRVKVDKHCAIDQFILDVQNNILEVAEFAAYTPLSKIQRWNDFTANEDMFQTLLVFENYSRLSASANNAIKFQRLKLWAPTHYPLTVNISTAETIKITTYYNKKYFDKSFIENLHGHMNNLIKQVVSKKYQYLSSVEMLTKQEKDLVQKKWAGKPKAVSAQTIHQVFEQNVTQYADRVAVLHKNASLSYEQLNCAANQLANYIINMELSEKAPVAIYLGYGLNYVVAILAVLKAGRAYVPVTLDYPIERLKHVIRASGAELIIVDDHSPTALCVQLPEINYINLMQSEGILASFPKQNPRLLVTQQDLAYILFTSGTTGKPKGIAASHQPIVNLINWQTKQDDGDKLNILQFANLAFDAAIHEISYALFNGHCLHIIVEEMRQSMDMLLDFIVDNNINKIFLQTALLNYFSAELNKREYDSLCLNEIFVAGEKLEITKEIRKAFKDNCGLQLSNYYGPTETHVVTAYTLPANAQEWDLYPSIGKPIDNSKVYILDKELNPLPVGIPGELHVSGKCLAQGYSDNKELTDNKFIGNPFSDQEDYQRMYKTGDIVYWQEDGQIGFVGRGDEQIKVSCFRVEPSEIEASILQHHAIKQNVVVTQENNLNNKYFVSYLVLEQGKNLSIDELQLFLTNVLPNYMIPSAFVILDRLPLNAIGKVNKKLLPPPQEAQLQNKVDYTAPRSKTEIELAEIFSDVLGVARIGVYDDFFNLGGYSLAALQVQSLCYQKFSVSLSINDLFNARRIAELAKVVEQALEDQYIAPGLSLVRFGHRQILSPIVPLQVKGNKKPLFLIHPVGGTAFWFVRLAQMLGQDRPCYGIQDPGIEAGDALFSTIEEMAAFYIKAIKQIQPHGPYYIGGASLGATVAVEISQQLLSMNERCAFLGLFDGWANYPGMLRNRNFFEEIMRRQYQDIYSQFVLEKDACPKNWLDLQWHRAHMLWNYQISSISQPMTLFKSDTVLPVFKNINDIYNNWQQYVKQPMKVYIVPGNHETIFEKPNVRVLAEKLNQCLEQLEVQRETLIE